MGQYVDIERHPNTVILSGPRIGYGRRTVEIFPVP